MAKAPRKPNLNTKDSRDEWIERLQIQLAACDAAALGATKRPAKQGDWGWSGAYQSVLNLRRQYDRLRKDLEKYGLTITDGKIHKIGKTFI